MSEYTDELVSQHLRQSPTLGRAYHEDPSFRIKIEVFRTALNDFDSALQQAGVGRDLAERVLTTVMQIGSERHAGYEKHVAVLQQARAELFSSMLHVPVELLRGTEDNR